MSQQQPSIPQNAQQQQSLQQQQAQQLVRPQDGELAQVVSHLEQALLGKDIKASDVLAKLVAAEEKEASSSSSSFSSLLSTFVPAQFLATAQGHFAPDKLQLSDAAALAAKEDGNKLFSSQRFDEAVLSFTKAMLSVESDQLYAVLLGNRSAAFISAGMTLAAALDTNKSIKLKPESEQLRVKLLDRRARCLAALGEAAAAEEDAAVCKKMSELLQKKQALEEAKKEDGEEIKSVAAQFDAVAVPDRDAVLKAKQQAAIDQPWTFDELVKLRAINNNKKQQQQQQQAEESSSPATPVATATFHPDAVFSMDTQALPYSATQSFRRYASLGKSFDPTKTSNGGDVLVETPAASAVRSDALLVVCAQCLRRSSALYPSEWHRSKFRRQQQTLNDDDEKEKEKQQAIGFRCRGVFCSDACDDLHWELHGKREFGVPFFMAASADVVCAARTLHASVAKQTVAMTSSSSSSGKLFSKLPEEVRPKINSNEEEEKTTTTWPIGDNVSLNMPRTQETESVSQSGGAIYGGQESATALLGLVLGNVFSSAKRAAAFVDTYRRVVSFLQPIMFVDRVFQSRNSSSSSSAAAGGGDTTHATVPVTAGVGYYPLATLFNHSCDPNCHVVFHGMPFSTSATLHLRLLRPVQEGEMLTVAWHSAVNKNAVHSTRSRIQLLRRLYGFTCCCSWCAGNPDAVLERNKQEMMIKAADYYQKGRRLIRERRDLAEASKVLQGSLELLFEHVCPPPDPPIFVVAKTFDAIAQAQMLQGDVSGALAYVQRRVDVLEKINGETNFEFVMELEKLAALIRSVNKGAGNDDEAVKERAVKLLRLMYPESVALKAELDIVKGK